MPSKNNDKHTDSKKHEEKQHVLHTRVSRKDAEKDRESSGAAVKNMGDRRAAKDCTEYWDDPELMEQNQKEYRKFQEENRKPQSTSEDHNSDGSEGGKKRGHGANMSTPNKKQKLGAAGDKNRVLKVGQKVQWHSLQGYVDGEVVEVVYEEKKVDGKNVKASKEDPRVVLKYASSGKICVHKPEAVYFD